MTTATNLSDAQWCLLDLLMRGRAKGLASIHRHELMNAPSLPVGVRIALVFAALTMPKDLVSITREHEFSVTDAGVEVFDLRFGKRYKINGAEPKQTIVDDVVIDDVIRLPGPAQTVN